MRKEVLVLTPFYPPNIGGVETFCKNLVKELKKHHNIKVCTINWGKQKLFKGVGIKQFLDIFPKLLPIFLKDISQDKFDIVQAQGFNSALIAGLFKKLYGYKLYITTHALYDFKSKGKVFKYLAKKILNQADKIFVEGEVVKQDILILGINESKLEFYCHWCDQEVFKPTDDSTIAQISKESTQGSKNSSKLRVLCAGRLEMAEKGVSLVQELERQLGKEIDFIYAKNIPHEDMPKYYQMVDVVIVPSVYSESFPIVVIEASSCGCAVITTDKGSLPELVGKFGIAVKEPYIDNMKEFLLLFKRNKILLDGWKEMSLLYAKLNFSSKNAEVFL